MDWKVELNKKIILLFIILASISFYSYSQNNNVFEIDGIVVSCKEKPFETDIILKVEKLIINGKLYKWDGKILIKTKRKIE